MIIQHNIMSLNAHRQLSGNTNQVSKNLEKLSSGYRINRAGDDAAGLAISEKMRSQIKSLDRAKMNAQDGISLIQTAEGALTETHSMLNRLVDLATESANGTIQADDRQKIQAEVEALTGEIDRISQATNFNGINLLDGSMGSGTTGVKMTSTANTAATAGNITAETNFSVSGLESGKTVTIQSVKKGDGASVKSDANGNITLSLDATKDKVYTQKDIDKLISDANLSGSAKNLKIEIDQDVKMGADGTTTVNLLGSTNVGTVKDAKNATIKGDAVANTAGANTNIILTATKAGTEANGNVLTFSNGTTGAEGATTGVNGNVALVLDAAKTYTASDINQMLGKGNAGMSVSFEGALKGDKFLAAGTGGATLTLAAGEGLSSGGGLTMQVGETADAYNKVTVQVANMGSSGLGIAALDLGTQSGAAAALDTIKNAVETVSVARGTLGALQNRLEHTISNLGVTSENMTAAESRIRDVDMAKEMMDFTKNNVLSQAAQAMLAQANQQPQQVLQLLR